MRIGIDLGGTKTEVIALGDAGEQLYRHRLPTPRDDYRQTIETIATLVDMAEQATGQRGTVGMGIPGSISPYTGVVKNANSTWLNGQPFDKDLSARLQREVRLANDANCLAVSEAVKSTKNRENNNSAVLRQNLNSQNGILGTFITNDNAINTTVECSNSRYNLINHTYSGSQRSPLAKYSVTYTYQPLFFPISSHWANIQLSREVIFVQENQ